MRTLILLEIWTRIPVETYCSHRKLLVVLVVLVVAPGTVALARQDFVALHQVILKP
ncbi:hypothetical protein [Alkalinema sp. FACHB-956]|uniref:hypothetical protein n=1 Tax=Alkalinema sp. FACHB-956 TaxID=2692768 RepID=UPI001686D0AE|nr:hypothetical protein [Alkalinema sp. FACHB-956]MBD2329248.1 hypothetical protein [Alkalinema sp. FACHB-956]